MWTIWHHAAVVGMIAFSFASWGLEAQGLVALLNPGGDRQMGALVPSSGNLHPIGLPAAGVPTGTVGGTETIDPAGNRFFFSGTPNGGVAKVYSLSTIHGAVLAGLRPRSALRRRLRRRQHQRLVGHRPL